MLHALIARLGTPDVHFLGHVSNEELTALYDVADLFLCASEHEGFCVPLVEAFYKRVPVLAYAATAVPATMDGGGVLYDTKDPFDVARLMDARARRRRASRMPSCSHRTRRSSGCAPATSPAPCSGSSTAALGQPPPRRRPSRLGLLAAVRPVRAARRAPAVQAGACTGRCREPARSDADPRPDPTASRP